MVGWILAGVIVVLAFGVGAVICAPWSPLNHEHKEAASLPIGNVDISRLRDGVFVGEYEGGMYRWRMNKVQVTIKSGKLTDIKLLDSASKNKSLNTMYDPLYASVIKAQSLEVDTVSGATLDSKAFLKGVEIALEKAEK